MRKRIRELAEGRVECAKPVVEFSVGRIELQIPEGEDYKGEFAISSKNHVPVRGTVYSSNPRVECKTLGFEGEEVRIQYEFHGTGLVEGNIQKGEFTVVCSQGEYSLSFVIIISKIYARTQMGTIQSLKTFTKLAQTHWQEARKLFYSSCFVNLFRPKEEKERLLYEGITGGQKTDAGLEEFLVACNWKEPVVITAEQTEFMFSGITEKSKQEVILSRNTWGYAELEVGSDAGFIEIPQKKITTEEFLGSQGKAVFYLNPGKMHAGRNFGSLVLKNVRQEIVLPVCARIQEEREKGSHVLREIQKCRADLVKAYVEYRLKQTVTGKWAAITLKLLDDLIVREPGNIWYRLLKAQTFWMNRQKQEAEWILNEFKRKWKDQKSPEWGYYLYICTLMDRDEAYINHLTEEIEQIYLEQKESPVLFWCLLFLREEYAQNRYQKLKALEERIMGGADSPVLYVEAYMLFLAEPYLMSRFGKFEAKILNWAKKHGVLTKALAEQVMSVFSGRLVYRERTLSLLEACYQLLDEDRMLAVICEYLIRSQIYGKDYFSWYALGVQKKLRITGLYEAYLMSMDARGVQDIPQIIQMYFKYNNQLGYRLKAVLYVNIIVSKAKHPDVYEQHYKGMEKFAYEQMTQGHIDDNLAVVYEEVLSHGIYFPEVSDAAAGILFVHRLTCFSPRAAKVIVLQEQLKKPYITSVLNGEAYFPLYSNDYCILIEDTYGNRFCRSLPYQLEKLMYPGRYLRACMAGSPDKIPYLLHYFSNRKAQEVFEEKDFHYFHAVMASEEVNPAYKAWLFPKMFGLLFLLGRTEEMKQQLKQIDFSYMKPKDRGCILEICIEKQFYAQAYEIIRIYGFGPIPFSTRIRFLNERIHELEFTEDEMLIKQCADTFLAGKYNDAMLEYLCRYYQGPMKTMVAIFQSAQGFYVDTQELAERILVQMLYTAGFVDCVDDVYKSYATAGSPLLKKAYLTYFSYHSFVGGMLLPDGFYNALRSFWKDGYGLNEVCELELLRYYAMHPSLLEKEEGAAEELLRKYLFQGICFAFYKKLGSGLLRKYQLYDKYFIEYHSQKHSRVKIYYTYTEPISDAPDRPAIGTGQEEMGEAYCTEDMTEVYDGIFVKKVTLFAGEAIQYYISEETGRQAEMTESGLLSCEPVQKAMSENRYERINEMIQLKAEGHTDQLQVKMLEYEQLDNTVGQAFTIV